MTLHIDMGAVAAALANLAFMRREVAGLRRALALKFDPNQPRVPAGSPEGGQWVREGGGGRPSAEGAPPVRFAQSDGALLRSARRSRDYCEAQYQRDLAYCRIMRAAGCYAQAMVRRVACEQGRPIPPLYF